MFPRVPRGVPVVVDLETTGLDWLSDYPVGYVVSWSGLDAVYLPTHHREGGNLPEESVHRFIRDVVKDASVVIGHNLKFDIHMARNDQIYLPEKVECTRVNAALIDENAGRYELDACCERAGVEGKSDQGLYELLAEKFGGDATKKAQMGNYWRLPGDHPATVSYAVGDGLATYQLWEWQQQELDHQNLRRVWEMEQELIHVLVDMERRGIRVDMERVLDFESWLERRLEESLRFLSRYDITNPKARTQMERAFRDAGYTEDDYDYTPKGVVSFNKEWLENKGGPLGEAINQARTFRTMLDSFVYPLSERHVKNGRVHANINQLKLDDKGVATGRLSYSGPNLQQVPKRGDKELVYRYRRCFLPDEGMDWDSADYQQQEPRVFAEYAQAKKLIEGYMKDPPIDMHDFTAALLNIPRDGQGASAKRMNLGLQYGMGARSLAQHMGISVQQATALKNRWMREVPEVKSFINKAMARAKKRGYVMDKLGRRRRFPRGWSAHKAGNAVIQMSCATMTKCKMIEVHRFLKENGSSLLLQVHDELAWQRPKESVWIGREAGRIMADFSPGNRVTFDIPIIAEVETGSDWGEVTVKGKQI